MAPPGFPPPTFRGQPPRFPPFPGFPLPPPDFMPKTVGDWTEHRLPDGRLYYYNNKSKESKWEKPKEFDGKLDKDENLKNEKEDKDKKQGVDEKSSQNNVPTEKKPVASRPIVGTGNPSHKFFIG